MLVLIGCAGPPTTPTAPAQNAEGAGRKHSDDDRRSFAASSSPAERARDDDPEDGQLGSESRDRTGQVAVLAPKGLLEATLKCPAGTVEAGEIDLEAKLMKKHC
jgi:hypothetical protein